MKFLSVTLFSMLIFLSLNLLNVNEVTSCDFSIEFSGSTLWSGISDAVMDGDLVYFSMAPGIQIYNIKDPEKPLFISQLYLDHRGMSIEKNGNLLYVGLISNGIQIIDVSDPQKPRIIGYYNSGGVAYGMTIQNHKAYILFSEKLEIVDIKVPSSPSLLGRFSLTSIYGQGPKQIEVVGDYAYVAADDLLILDVSVPDSVREISRFPTYRQISEDLEIRDNLVYLADKTISMPPDWSRLTIVDVSDVYNPTLVSSYKFDGNLFNITLSDNYVYLGAGLSGVMIFNVENPENPIPEGCIYTPGYAYEILPMDDTILVVHEGNVPHNFDDYAMDLCHELNPDNDPSLSLHDTCSFYIVDVTDKASPRLIGSVLENFRVDEVQVYDNLIFVRDEHQGVTILEKKSQDQYNILSRIIRKNRNTLQMFFSDNYLYLTDLLTGFCIYDIHDPTNPVLESDNNIPGKTFSIYAVDSIVYVTNTDYGLILYNASKPDHPAALNSIATSCISYRIVVKDEYAFLSEGICGFEIYDVSDIYSVSLISSLPQDNSPWFIDKLKIRNNNIFLLGIDTIFILDISDISNPRPISNIASSEDFSNIDLVDNYLIAHPISTNNTRVYDIEDITAPVLCNVVMSPLEYEDSETSDWFIFSADWGSLIEYKISIIEEN